MTLTFGSLFAGVGGFDLGLERAGMVCKWQVEIDDWCRQVLAKHWPDVPRYEDVRDVGRDSLEPVDLICGGFPCQDLSVAGRREGLAGERSGLWFQFHRVLAELRPRWAVIENVPGLLSSRRGADFATLLRGLVELGYGVCWRIFDAQFDGVAQRRRRVFVVGHLGNGRGLAAAAPNQDIAGLVGVYTEVLFEREGGAWDPPPSREEGETTTALTGSGPGANGGADDNAAQGRQLVAQGFGTSGYGYWREGVGPLPERQWRDAENGLVVAQCHGNNVSPMGTLRHGAGHISSGVPFVAFTNRGLVTGEKTEPTRAGSHGALPMVAFDRTQSSVSGDVAGPLRACGAQAEGVNDGKADVQCVATLSPSLGKESFSPTKSSSGQMIDFCVGSQYGVRRLTPTECERLQDFPDGWTEGNSDTQRYRQLGNAVWSSVAEWLGRRILEVET